MLATTTFKPHPPLNRALKYNLLVQKTDLYRGSLAPLGQRLV